jgi:hypothetical protein
MAASGGAKRVSSQCTTTSIYSCSYSYKKNSYSCSLYEPPTYTLRARSNSLYGCTYGCSYSYAVLLYILHPVYTPAYSETMPWSCGIRFA